MIFKCPMCKTTYEFDADVRKRLLEELAKFEFHMHSTHGIHPDSLRAMYRDYLKKQNETAN